MTETSTDNPLSGEKTAKKTSVPPDGYVCNLCGVAGHWIQQCSQKEDATTAEKKSHRGKKRKQQHGHEYREGIDPSPKDIEEAKKMQQLEPPLCDCGKKSRVKKVKRSKVSESSRAVGAYFFFCAKKKDDPSKCNFVKPVEEMQKPLQDKKQSNFFAKKRKGVLGSSSSSKKKT